MARPKIGLVLGGGGSRGIAHVGVLEVLHHAHIPIDFIVGTSMGAIIGVLYALGYDPDKVAERITSHMQGSNVLNMNFFSARARQRMVEEQLHDAIGDKTFDDLHIHTIVMAVDMVHGKEVALGSGNLMPAILASSAVPAVFPPVKIDNMELADGGVIDSLATHMAYHMGADKIIAVDVYPALETDNPWVDPLSAIAGIELPFGLPILPSTWSKTPGIAAAMWRSVRVMTWHLHQQRLQAHPAHILIRPNVDRYGSLDFKDVLGPIQAGIIAAEAQLEQIKALAFTEE